VSKRVVSLRLSDVSLSELDSACERLGMNRSTLLEALVGTLDKYVDDGGKLTERTEWLLAPLTQEKKND
jgi:hypothetical protein